MTKTVAYPAANHEEAEARAALDAAEHGWALMQADWHPRQHGGVLVLVVDLEDRQVPASA